MKKTLLVVAALLVFAFSLLADPLTLQFKGIPTWDSTGRELIGPYPMHVIKRNDRSIQDSWSNDYLTSVTTSKPKDAPLIDLPESNIEPAMVNEPNLGIQAADNYRQVGRLLPNFGVTGFSNIINPRAIEELTSGADLKNGVVDQRITQSGGHINGYNGMSDVHAHNAPNVSLEPVENNSVPVPEPSSLILLGIGMIGITSFVRRKIKNGRV